MRYRRYGMFTVLSVDSPATDVALCVSCVVRHGWHADNVDSRAESEGSSQSYYCYVIGVTCI